VHIGGQFVDENGAIKKTLSKDTVHLNKKGLELWAKSIEPTLAKLLGEK